MSRAFFDQIDDELRGLLGPTMREFQSAKSGRLFKLWYEEPQVHFEVQEVSARWSPTRKPVMEVGLHFEFSEPKQNEDMLEVLIRRNTWKKSLASAEAGPALGPRGRVWRRISELIPVSTDSDDPDFADELAERLAEYVKILKPLVARR